MNVLVYYLICFIIGLFMINPEGLPLYMILSLLMGAFYEISLIIIKWIEDNNG